MHCFDGPQWLHLKRGRESFARGPVVKVDPQGRCGGVLVYGLQMIILKASQVPFAFQSLLFGCARQYNACFVCTLKIH